MFKEGDIVNYRNITGKVVFSCELSISILIGNEFPMARQIRVVVYNYDWGEVNLISDGLETGTPAHTVSRLAKTSY